MGVIFKIPSVSQIELTPLMVRGFDDVDDVQLVNVVDRTAADGTRSQGSTGFQRLITIDLGVVKEKSDRTFLVDWMMAYNREAEYAGESLAVISQDAKGFSSVIKESKYFRRFLFSLVERVPRTTVPIAWGGASAGMYTSDGKPVITSDGEVVYAHP